MAAQLPRENIASAQGFFEPPELAIANEKETTISTDSYANAENEQNVSVAGIMNDPNVGEHPNYN